MYDELIKRLRETSKDFGELDNVSVMLLEAANAIEDIFKELRMEKVDNINLTGQLVEEHAKHLWIPVTERLPEEDGRYLVSYPLFNVEAWMRVAYFSTDLHRTNEYAFLGKKYKRPGFYYSDDEYGDVELQDVTHWMPLPEPPEEE